MARKNSLYICQECGAQSPKWLGRCPECGEWNTLVEEAVEEAPSAGGRRILPRRDTKPLAYKEIGTQEDIRIGTGITGFDTVLGGGIVPGSLVLVAGEPGAGKSTLMLQVCARLADRDPVLYVSGEESETQVKLRGSRLGIKPENLLVYSETELEAILRAFDSVHPALVVIDSVQTSWSGRFTSAPGSVTQVRETAATLLELAKSSNTPIFLIGHVTKEGRIAGPKTMEHIVDTVVMLEGDRSHSFRIVRALKNRFGPVSELAAFEMRSTGLEEVGNISELFLAERAVGTPGSVVTAAVEGTRPMLVEVQALISPIPYGPGRRTCEGFDHNRLALLLAILERRAGLNISPNDVFVNVVGGVKLSEPSVDLAVATAATSSLLDRPLPESVAVFGELGLGGEVRSVTSADLRVKEATALGLKDIYLPAKNARNIKAGAGIKLHPVENIADFIQDIFGRS